MNLITTQKAFRVYLMLHRDDASDQTWNEDKLQIQIKIFQQQKYSVHQSKQ